LNRKTLWLECRRTTTPPRLRLFCLPHAGGSSAAFSSWHTGLPVCVQVCSVILPGREKRHSEPLYTQIEPVADAIARELKPWLDMPYAVFGHSMGALLAFEWMRRAQHERCTMPAWLFLSGRRAPDVEGDTSLLHSLPDDEFLKELKRRYEGMSEEILRTPELVEFYRPILRADISVVESYRFQEDGPLDCPITVFAGMNDASTTMDQMFAWKRQTRRRFAVQLLPGGHFYPKEPLLQTISATLAEWCS
jgi:medium-chain acyl-[acyl-carrier-protein] hydrolase